MPESLGEIALDTPEVTASKPCIALHPPRGARRTVTNRKTVFVELRTHLSFFRRLDTIDSYSCEVVWNTGINEDADQGLVSTLVPSDIIIQCILYRLYI
jgi:hypothetical protein